MRLGLAVLMFLAACAAPTVEDALEEKIAKSDSCFELEVILTDVVRSYDAGDLSLSVAVDLAEFATFRAFELADDMRSLGYVSPSLERCEELADSLLQALFAP